MKGEVVRVYRNLHRQCYSVQVKLPEGWRVRSHLTGPFILTNVTFHVNQGGYRRYLRTAQRNVHAFVVGTYEGQSYTAIEDLTLAYKDVTRVRYVAGAFYNANSPVEAGKPIYGPPLLSAQNVWLTPQGVYATGVRYATGG